jgi:K+-sensing histidine kinase KdpD
MTQVFPRIRHVAAAITISPRMVAVLATARHFAERLNAPLHVIHGGAPDAQKEAEFRGAMFQLEMPRETRIVWNEGEPAGAIVTAAEKEGVDLLIAGALEGKDVSSRSFPGAVAQRLAIILIGLLANTCIGATGRIGMELGCHVTLVRDATAAYSHEAMHAAMNIDGPTYAHEILTTVELVSALENIR